MRTVTGCYFTAAIGRDAAFESATQALIRLIRRERSLPVCDVRLGVAFPVSCFAADINRSGNGPLPDIPPEGDTRKIGTIVLCRDSDRFDGRRTDLNILAPPSSYELRMAILNGTMVSVQKYEGGDKFSIAEGKLRLSKRGRGRGDRPPPGVTGRPPPGNTTSALAR